MNFKLSEYVPPLRLLRRKSDLKLSEIIDRGTKDTCKFPRDAAALCMIETRGTRDVDIIYALAAVYGKPFKTVSEAARRPSVQPQETFLAAN